MPGESSSGVVPTGQNSYMITRTRWGFLGPEVVKAAALKEAGDYCQSHGKVLLVTKTVEISVKFGSRPAAEVYFKALDPNDPQLKNPPAIEDIVR